MKNLFLFFLACFLAACAARTPQQPQQEPDKAWQAMLAASDKANSSYRMQLSMRFGEEGNTRRINALLWGNGENALRLDIMAGVGVTLAKISDSPAGFLLYSPKEDRAYIQKGATRPMLKIGMPVPFSLPQLADLLTGNFTSVFGRTFVSAAPVKAGMSYTLEEPVPGILCLNAQGAPVMWRQDNGAWELQIGYDEEMPLLPKNIRLENSDGKFAFILVKQRDDIDRPFTNEQLDLTVPQHIKLLPLSEYKAS